ncbi:MAG: asparagine synthase (glutamine-hydrolyzing), partial [Candidatus Buchananbacteria bacterium]
MCGIVGFIDKKNHLSKTQGEKIIKEMIKSLRHRGRDDEGFFAHNNVYLGQARLSIIDLTASGHQPMISSSEKTVTVFNGEIYNFLNTKNILQANKKFQTNCDTEILLNAYEQWGLEKSLAYHKGMFAFGLLDKEKNQLHLSVDRFGIKPLYYINNKNFFAFASEIKALLKIPGVKAELNRSGLEEYLIFRHLAGKNTLFKNIFKLSPANYLSIDLRNYNFTQKQYWRLSKHKINNNNYHKLISNLLNASIKEHLIADVPVGLQLSGGVDSSLVASLASKQSKKNIHSFSIGLKDKNWNEFFYSQKVAKKIKTQHHQLLFSEKQFCSLLPKLTYHLDEPMDHSHSIPMYLLAKYARNKVKILLSGEGADEIFGGYKKYKNIDSRSNDRDIINLSAFGDKNILSQVIKVPFKNKFVGHEKILKEYKHLKPFDKLSILDQKI